VSKCSTEEFTVLSVSARECVEFVQDPSFVCVCVEFVQGPSSARTFYSPRPGSYSETP
jgi:hypothetical protein